MYRNSQELPQTIRNVPTSYFAMNPGAQPALAAALVIGPAGQALKRSVRRVWRVWCIIKAVSWAFVHPGLCHRATWKREWAQVET